MKSKDVRIGMKVVPFQKTAGVRGFPTWRDVTTVKRANDSNQPFLFVVGWNKDSKCWILSNVSTVYSDWALFSSKDFYPYTGENHEI